MKHENDTIIFESNDRRYDTKVLTVEQVIAKLKEFPLDMPVMVDGYEDGYDAVTCMGIQQKDLSVEENPPYYKGEWNDGCEFTAVVLSRYNGRREL